MTLLQHHIGTWTDNFIQILHCSQRHQWITVSTIGCMNGEVKIYDTLFKDIDENTKDKIEKTFSCSIKLSLSNIHQQDGDKDCGLYAIAIATVLAFEGDKAVLNHKFDQSKLRPHLCHCLETQHLTTFP